MTRLPTVREVRVAQSPWIISKAKGFDGSNMPDMIDALVEALKATQGFALRMHLKAGLAFGTGIKAQTPSRPNK